jgi:glycosyltransferase involved in cell wall biosynthesis
MKIYLTPPQPDRGLERIATALRRYAPPSVTVHTFPRNNDLTVIYAIGRRDAIERQVEDILKRGQRYAIIQICLRSTMQPHTSSWREIWHGAEIVWSYYDLNQAIADDGGACGIDNFYHAPLGADAKMFYPRTADKEFVIGTTGPSRLQESVRECILAAKELDKTVFHLGMDMTFYDNVAWAKNINDEAVAQAFSRCEFVSGLRRKEGFELPAVEGLLCGARPIVFDTPDYRWNYGDHAEYITEGTRQEVVDQLVKLFKQGARGVTEEERADAVERFNWKTIVGGFYDRIGG